MNKYSFSTNYVEPFLGVK